MKQNTQFIPLLLIISICFLPISVLSRPFVLVISQDDLTDGDLDEKNSKEEYEWDDIDDPSVSMSSPDPSLSAWRSVFDDYYLNENEVYHEKYTAEKSLDGKEQNEKKLEQKSIHGNEVYDGKNTAEKSLNGKEENGDEKSSGEKILDEKRQEEQSQGEESGFYSGLKKMVGFREDEYSALEKMGLEKDEQNLDEKKGIYSDLKKKAGFEQGEQNLDEKNLNEETGLYSDLKNVVEFGEDEKIPDGRNRDEKSIDGENLDEKDLDKQNPDENPKGRVYSELKEMVKFEEDERNPDEKKQDEQIPDEKPRVYSALEKMSAFEQVEKSPEEKQQDRDEKTRVYKALIKMVGFEVNLMMEGAGEMEREGERGNPHAMSVVGFMYNFGIMREKDKGKAFLYHYFAAQGGNMESKLFLAYTYLRQHMYEKAVKLYAELAEVAVNSFLTSKDQPVLETVRIHIGAEENKEALRKSRGEEDEDFQILEYQAQKGNAVAMYKIGVFYYFGLRGLRRDYVKALTWFLKAVERGEPRSMEVLGEMYAKGAGVERNYTKSFGWLKLASRQHLYSAYNGMGYLYLKGYGVEEKNFTKAKEYFERAADNDEAGGNYNLGVMYLKGIGVKRNVKLACKYFIGAANSGQPKAFFQLAKMFHTGVGLKKNIPMATALYKLVAERGPWSSLSRWALESYLKGDVGKAFFLYSRMSELGYEIAQSNAAWILDKYGDRSMCIGESGFCTNSERYQRAHSLWWQASEQGNEHAALLIGDAYYYGRGTERDYDRAAEAYMHAKSQSNAQAMFNLGYMHEHGQGLPLDLHLAKRYYDQALEFDRAAKLPVTVALACLWIRRNYASSFLVDWIDSLPEMYPKVDAWVQDVIMEEGNMTIFTLFVCLLTVLYLRERQRRHAIGNGPQPPQPHIQIPHM